MLDFGLLTVPLGTVVGILDPNNGSTWVFEFGNTENPLFFSACTKTQHLCCRIKVSASVYFYENFQLGPLILC